MVNLSLPSLNEQAEFNESVIAQTKENTTSDVKFMLAKRLFDIVISSIVILLLLSWFIPIIGILIRLTSPGPILFVQLRTGYNGRPFRCFKFRTMTYDRNAEFRQATQNDCRVTAIGRFLRKTNLDELPQVLNVFLGEMSIVGPRPHPVQLDAQYWRTMPGYPARYLVKPGITGLAQVSGSRGETETLLKMKQRVRFDHFYIYKSSFLFDLRICWLTAVNMVRGDKNAC
ncbi:sugar transferase [Spirosoma sp.]|uniref:sugar transferase n=1 Tax=Spirosoma sp. TaxID=1899569 RepID=UPI002622F14B|nr:sugar transferase [Spirosoma sp.]MCX6218966.1 sugar transferase [Spirosoma sp.]